MLRRNYKSNGSESERCGQLVFTFFLFGAFVQICSIYRRSPQEVRVPSQIVLPLEPSTFIGVFFGDALFSTGERKVRLGRVDEPVFFKLYVNSARKQTTPHHATPHRTTPHTTRNTQHTTHSTHTPRKDYRAQLQSGPQSKEGTKASLLR